MTCPNCGSKLEYLVYYETVYNKYTYDGEGLKLVESQINEWETYFACPYCGSKFPNRPKVHDGKCWWWRCYTEDCVVRYYEPERMLVELRGTGETVSYEELWRLFGRGEKGWSG